MGLSQKHRMRWWREVLLLAPHLGFLVTALLRDRRISAKHKILLAACAAYLISPVDLIPYFIPILGHLDDLIIVLIVFDGILNHLEPELLREHWRGSPEVLAALQKWSGRVARFIPTGIKRRIFSVKR